MTQDPHRSSWDSPEGEQPVEPSAGPSQPEVSPQPSAQGGAGGWAQPSWPAQEPPPGPAQDGPYGGGPPGYGAAPGYGQPAAPAYPPSPGYGPAPGYGQAPQQYGYAGVPASAAPRGSAPTSAIVLVVLSGLLTLVLSWTLVGLLYAAPTVLAVVALARSGNDPAAARRTSRTGWITFGVVTVLLGLLVVVGAVLLATYSGGSGGSGGAGGVSV